MYIFQTTESKSISLLILSGLKLPHRRSAALHLRTSRALWDQTSRGRGRFQPSQKLYWPSLTGAAGGEVFSTETLVQTDVMSRNTTSEQTVSRSVNGSGRISCAPHGVRKRVRWRRSLRFVELHFTPADSRYYQLASVSLAAHSPVVTAKNRPSSRKKEKRGIKW